MRQTHEHATVHGVTEIQHPGGDSRICLAGTAPIDCDIAEFEFREGCGSAFRPGHRFDLLDRHDPNGVGYRIAAIIPEIDSCRAEITGSSEKRSRSQQGFGIRRGFTEIINAQFGSRADRSPFESGENGKTGGSVGHHCQQRAMDSPVGVHDIGGQRRAYQDLARDFHVDRQSELRLDACPDDYFAGIIGTAIVYAGIFGPNRNSTVLNDHGPILFALRK
ncbi:hypothetical protein ACFYU5_26395 [Nocardia aobensis]|uniref:Uncharacterized protein n=1 Tax=Nocardia aobensis TaxID=257277 RepID=A0ABW6P9X7_9NOCA